MTTEERLEKLEKELAGAKRRSRVMLVAVALTVAGVLLLGASDDTVQKVIRAEKFELVDSTGKSCAELRLSEFGQPGLYLTDQNGTRRAFLGLTGLGEPGLCLYDQSGQYRVILDLESGRPSLDLTDRSGKTLAALDVAADGTPGLNLSDPNGKTIWHAP